MVPKMVAVESGGQVCSQSAIHIQQLPWLAVDRLWPWLELAGQFISFLASTNGQETTLCPCRGTNSCVYSRQFSVRRSVHRLESPESLLMRGCGKGHEPKVQKSFS